MANVKACSLFRLTVAPVLAPAPHAAPLHPGLLLSEKLEHLRVLDQARIRCSFISLKVYAETPGQSQATRILRKIHFEEIREM